MKKISLSIVFLSFFLTSCSAFCPFVDTRREAGQAEPIGQSRPAEPAICYNGWVDTPADLQALADETCQAEGKTAADYQRTKAFSCRLVTPRTAFFKCVD